jgi:hypothetical protein
MTPNQHDQQTSTTLQDTATAIIASGTKTPFSTAFKITLGIGLARLSLFLLGVGVIAGSIAIYNLTK